MFNIMNDHYKKVMGKPIQFSDLGSTTDDFNIFVTQTIQSTVTSTQFPDTTTLFEQVLPLLDSKTDFSVNDLIQRIKKKVESICT